MSLRSILAPLLLITITPPLAADKFHFGSSEEAEQTQGNAGARVVSGVLLSESSDTYTIRVVGGQMTLPKASVSRVERDALTVAQIEQQEKDQASAVAAADKRRRDVQAAEATARRSATERNTTGGPIEAPARDELRVTVDFQGRQPGYEFRVYDPVMHRAVRVTLQELIESYLRTQTLLRR
ncbi:MAG: hypothetical protein KDC87_21360 [Planctomycetes bacterium]|nr:hypothetical protein [Planctomycetota bacterium]MCB9871014.1 hypothetical protein [Planctomycetota bacterium]